MSFILDTTNYFEKNVKLFLESLYGNSNFSKYMDKCVAAKSQKFSGCHSGTVTKLFYYIELLCRTEI